MAQHASRALNMSSTELGSACLSKYGDDMSVAIGLTSCPAKCEAQASQLAVLLEKVCLCHAFWEQAIDNLFSLNPLTVHFGAQLHATSPRHQQAPAEIQA